MNYLKPQLLESLADYSKEKFLKDLVSGVIVAIIALPLSIALALASGVTPEQGLYTAIVAGFLISALGGSKVQIAGPTAAFASIVAGMCFDALEQGSIDMFVEYTGTALLNLLAQPMDTDKDRVWQTVHDLMLEEHGIQTSNPLGYNNTYVMSVKPETAEKYGLTSLSDLIEKSPELRLGCTVEFMDREDCLPLLESKYGTAFQDVKGLDASLRYTAIENDEVDVVDAFATDALLSKLGLTMLEDDLSFFPPYYAVNFVDAELLESDPELAEVLSRLDGAIDEATMAAMNAQVDVDGMSAQEVAHQFLVEHGLVTE